jgi:16S rRNA (cytosine967-C5)-methyltransferase
MRARNVALHVLADMRAGRRTARQSLDELLARYAIIAEDRALAAELVWGVTRHRLTLEAILRLVVEAKWTRLSRALQHILLVGAYQLIWLDAVPAFAAINEAVEQGKREGGRRLGGFVNGILRGLQRRIIDRNLPEPSGHPQACVQTGPRRYCRFDAPVLPDPLEHYDAYLAAATSHPEPLVRRLIHNHGREHAQQVCWAGVQRPPLVLRPNALRTTAAALAERLRSEGCVVECVGERAVAVVEPRAAGPLLKTAAFADGLFQPQDVTAMRAVERLDPRPDHAVVDYCAGVGTKATQAAERMHDRGTVLAADVDPDKLARLESNCQRLGITCVHATPAERLPSRAAALDRLDAILVDAPCSNTGVLARRPEARYRFTPRGVETLAQTQVSLLTAAAALARPGTRLVYSTCSIDPAENEAVIQAFGQAHPQWRVERSELILPAPAAEPAQWRDGGFVALLVR